MTIRPTIHPAAEESGQRRDRPRPLLTLGVACVWLLLFGVYVVGVSQQGTAPDHAAWLAMVR